MVGTIAGGDKVQVPFQINETDTLAGTSFEGIAPVTGCISGIYVVTAKAVTTGGSVKVQKGASTDVVGATVTVADGATKGTIYSAQSTPGDASRAVTKGDRFQVVPDAAFNTAGAVNGFVEFDTFQ